MPCTYCGNLRHTRSKCSLIEKDFNEYKLLSILVRKKFVDNLLDSGIKRNTVVKTYNREGGWGSSECKLVSLGNLDILSCYEKIGRSLMSVVLSSRLVIEVDDDNPKLISRKQCNDYESNPRIVTEGDSDWSKDWIQTQLLDFSSFKATFKNKKRHPAFTRELYNCIANELTVKKETLVKTLSKTKQAYEEVELYETQDSGSVYVVTSTSISDDYKRPYSSSDVKTATSYEDAVALASYMYLDRAIEYDAFSYQKDLLLRFKEEVVGSSSGSLADRIYDFFTRNEEMFVGEYVPCTFSLHITDNTTSTVNLRSLVSMISNITKES
jgi:hypothetical protein